MRVTAIWKYSFLDRGVFRGIHRRKLGRCGSSLSGQDLETSLTGIPPQGLEVRSTPRNGS